MKKLIYWANRVFAYIVIVSVLLGALLWVGVMVIALSPDILTYGKPFVTLAVCFLLSAFFVLLFRWYMQRQQDKRQDYEK